MIEPSPQPRRVFVLGATGATLRFDDVTDPVSLARDGFRGALVSCQRAKLAFEQVPIESGRCWCSAMAC